jgi:hypothetical protein
MELTPSGGSGRQTSMQEFLGREGIAMVLTTGTRRQWVLEVRPVTKKYGAGERSLMPQ